MKSSLIEASGVASSTLTNESFIDTSAKVYYEVWNGFIKGLYKDDRKNPVSDKCFGNWMPQENIVKVADLLDDASWVPQDLAISAGTDFIDILSGNIKHCQFERPVQDWLHWCLANHDYCSFDGMDSNIRNNMMPLIANGFDLFETMMEDQISLGRLY